MEVAIDATFRAHDPVGSSCSLSHISHGGSGAGLIGERGPIQDEKEKRPRLFQVQDALGSPPPELPNHEMDIKIPLMLCKRHFGNSVSAKLS